MKAITVTQILKDLNISLFKNNNVGSIKLFGDLPKSFYSVNYNNGQRTDAYQTLYNSIHESDGFFDYIEPVYNVLTQKLGDIYFNVNVFTMQVINLTQAEIDKNLANKDEAEDEAEEQRNEDDGIALVRHFRKRIRRRLKRGVLNQNQYERLRRDLKDVFYLLKNGDWDFSIIDIALVSYNNTTLQDEVNWLSVKINEYLI